MRYHWAIMNEDGRPLAYCQEDTHIVPPEGRHQEVCIRGYFLRRIGKSSSRFVRTMDEALALVPGGVRYEGWYRGATWPCGDGVPDW